MKLVHWVKQEDAWGSLFGVYTDTFIDGTPGPVLRWLKNTREQAEAEAKRLNEIEY